MKWISCSKRDRTKKLLNITCGFEILSDIELLNSYANKFLSFFCKKIERKWKIHHWYKLFHISFYHLVCFPDLSILILLHSATLTLLDCRTTIRNDEKCLLFYNRTSRSQMFHRIDIPKNSAKFTRKDLCRSLNFIT